MSKLLGSDEKAIAELTYRQLDRVILLLADNDNGSDSDGELLNYLIDLQNQYGNGTGELLTKQQLIDKGLLRD